MSTRFKREIYYVLEYLRFLAGAGGQSGRVPHHAKRRVVREHQKRWGLKVFIETGTYMGDMTAAMLPRFDQIHTVELGRELYEGACRRFQGIGKVQVYHGDSAGVLPLLLNNLAEPALFWLDAHYSGGITARGTVVTPIEAELSLIFRRPEISHVVLIDDARLFGSEEGYPPLDRLQSHLASVAPHHTVRVESDIIQVEPSDV